MVRCVAWEPDDLGSTLLTLISFSSLKKSEKVAKCVIYSIRHLEVGVQKKFPGLAERSPTGDGRLARFQNRKLKYRRSIASLMLLQSSKWNKMERKPDSRASRTFDNKM